MTMATTTNGTVTRLLADKGFGFIKGESGTEYFFHRSSCDGFDTLREGQRVSFTPGQGAKGPRAENVSAQ
jgi:cold shock protein